MDNYTDIIINQSNKLNQHIEKILNIAKSDSTAMALNIKNIEVIPVLDAVIENMRLKYNYAIIRIEKDNPTYTIQADEFHFTNLVYNLLDNAIKYCEVNPEIVIAISEVKQQLQIAFVDNGIGIAQKNIAFIFDKFYRIPNNKSNEINGFGLGLYYVKKICLFTTGNSMQNPIPIQVLRFH